MRRRIVAGNWKMNTTRKEAIELASAIAKGATDDRVEVIVCPPFPYLEAVGSALVGSKVALGAQNCHDQLKGAFTGEVSPAMLLDLGCKYVIIGHSERRHKLDEKDSFINHKVTTALEAGLQVILCVGETQAERDAGQEKEVFFRQVAAGLGGVPLKYMPGLILAYEPVWAIGTGRTASPDEAQLAHAYIRGRITQLFGEKVSSLLPILYGGSVDREKAPGLFAEEDLDGGLIGGASLKSAEFLEIVKSAASTIRSAGA